MVILRLKGGLGNQMFQFATAYALKSGPIFVDLKKLENYRSISLDNYTPRSYELKIFKDLPCILYKEIFRKFLEGKYPYQEHVRNLIFGTTCNVRQIENEFVDIPPSKYLILDGYFQSEKYFTTCRDQLLNIFKFPKLDEYNSIIKSSIQNSANSVSVHIRRGDYTKKIFNDYHGILPISYYNNAINLINSRIESPHYFIFSDDISWAKSNLKYLCNSATYISHNLDNNSWKDMALMSQCKHHIVANSSFSWWGAWLDCNIGLTIAPSEWFNSKNVSFKICDIIPQKWILIGND